MSTWLYTKRKERGLSQGEIATSLDISRPTYTAIETGKRTATPAQLQLLAQILDLTVSDVTRELERDLAVHQKTPDVVLREVPNENTAKFKQTLLYILNKVGGKPNIGQTALYKLLYFIDFDYYEQFEKPLIGATYIRNTFGPTPVSFAKIVKQMEQAGQLVTVKSKHFNFDQTKYLATTEADTSVLSEQELKHIDAELERLGGKSARELSALSHLDTPWRVAKEKEILNYEHVFYRPVETTTRSYEPL